MLRSRVWLFYAFVAILIGSSLSADEEKKTQQSAPKQGEDRPAPHPETVSDAYLEGYIQALLNVHYYEFNVIVEVENHTVYLFNLPKNDLLSGSIITFVKVLPSVDKVVVAEGVPNKELETRELQEVRPQVKGIWFPQSTVLFQPLVADPREPTYSVGYRAGDNVMGNKVIAISLGDFFPIFRWRNVFRWQGDLQIDIEAGVWSVFKMGRHPDTNEFSELVTTDYLVGIPLSYAFDKWSFRLRIYHVSSHLGDEFMVNNPQVTRKNPSMEAMDFLAAFQFTEGLRLYAGPGWVMHSDHTYPLDPLYIQYGGELRILGSKNFYHNLYGTPFLAINLRNWQEHDWRLDGTYMIGYEWSKLQGVGRKIRVFVEYHNGYSEGQFFKKTTSYVSFRLSYGF